MLKMFLVISGIFSFLYFLFPNSFVIEDNTKEQILGINRINAVLNKNTVTTALYAFCLSEGRLPGALSQLYPAYLEERPRIDLDKIFDYKALEAENCRFELLVRN